MPLSHFHSTIRRWFEGRFGAPTEPQREGWQKIRSGRHTLISAPTGTGKTIAGYLWAIDGLARQGAALEDKTEVLYISPLRALSNDVQKNLERPLAELAAMDAEFPEIRVAVRTGDTLPRDRAAMLRKPPHILVTTPESLYILLTARRGREMLRTVKTVIVDEIHALAKDKRGSHLALSLERLEELVRGQGSGVGGRGTEVGGQGREPTVVEASLAVLHPHPGPLPSRERERTASLVRGQGSGVGGRGTEGPDSVEGSLGLLQPHPGPLPSRERTASLRDEAEDVGLQPSGSLTRSQRRPSSAAVAVGSGLNDDAEEARGLKPTLWHVQHALRSPSPDPRPLTSDPSPSSFQRIGLSATQKPLSEVGRFLVGVGRECELVDVGHRRAMDVAVEVPPSPLSTVCSHEQWDEIYGQIAALIEAHRTTLIFVNTRKMAERITARLTEVMGEEQVTCHHSSLSKERRLDAEARLKAGKLRALVATASLELGIDIGDVDLVVQVGATRSIATLLQRVGRSGHAIGKLPKGRLFPLTTDELVEAAALMRAIKRGDLDRTPQPAAPLDILAQQIVAECVAASGPVEPASRRFEDERREAGGRRSEEGGQRSGVGGRGRGSGGRSQRSVVRVSR